MMSDKNTSKLSNPTFNIVNDGSGFIFKQEAKSTWEWAINGKFEQMKFTVNKAPNLFHRMIQRVVLGIHWRKS